MTRGTLDVGRSAVVRRATMGLSRVSSTRAVARVSARRCHSLQALGALVVCVSLAVVCVPASVRAQSSDAARLHYERGIELYDEGQYAAALAEFEAAYAGSQRASLLFNIGQLHARLGRAVEAVDALERYLRDAGDSVPADRRTLVVEEIAIQRTRIASVSFVVSVPDAVVSIDDEDVGRAPLPGPVRVSAGEHVVVARAEGFEPARFRFRVAGGDTRSVSLELIAHAESSARLRLLIAVPGAEVRIDGRSIGLSPIELPVGLPEGEHIIEVTRPGYEPLERRVRLPPSGEASLELSLVPAIQPPQGVITRLRLALPSTSHTIQLDGTSVPPGTDSLEVPYGVHDIAIVGEDMLPVRQRIDVPAGSQHVFAPRYEWLPERRERARAQASSLRIGGAIAMTVGSVLTLGGAAFFIGREVQYAQGQIGARESIVTLCNMFVGGMPPPECEVQIRMHFPLEGDPAAFEAETNRQLAVREALAIAGGVTLGVGVGVLITGLVVYLLAQSDELIDADATRQPRVSLDVGPGGLALRGSF